MRHVGVDPVVDGEVARGANRPDKVDRHLAAQPGRGRRAEQYVDRHSGLGECVAGVVDALIGDGDEVAAVVRPRQLRMDDVVPLADGGDREPRIELLPVATTVTRSATSGASSRILSARSTTVKTGASVARKWSGR